MKRLNLNGYGWKPNLPLLLVLLLAGAVMSAIGIRHIRIDSDIVSSLPHDDPVIKDAMHLFANHPLQDQLTIDVGLDRDDPDLLVECGRTVEQALRESGVFKSVGMDSVAKGLPELMQTVVKRLPVLFTMQDLEEQVKPLLTPEKIARRIEDVKKGLLQMDGIGQAGAIAVDPLGLKDLILGRLLYLAPTSNARIYKGHLISGDGRHLLVTAVPAGSGTDTTLARRLEKTVDRVSDQVHKVFKPRGVRVALTPVGAYRAALDNEVIVRRDVQYALWLTTLGIIVLLLLSFPRPLIGLLSMLPAMAGTVAALFAMSLIYKSISVIVLGFGGAIISITVDHGVAYFLFMDRPNGSLGKEAADEVRSASLIATLTTMGAFGALIFSGFPIFGQLGMFAALGHFFSFLFIQLIFPHIFPSLKDSGECWRPLPSLAERLFSLGSKGALAALAFFVVMVFFARPDFNVNLSAMSTVSRETQAAEQTMLKVWGNIFGKVYLMAETPSLDALEAKGDQLLSRLEADPDHAVLEKTFLPAMIFPGAQRSAANLTSWKRFWSPERIAEVGTALRKAGSQAGFKADAFDPFLDSLAESPSSPVPESIPAELFPLLGISHGQGVNPWRQVVSLVLPQGYPGEAFYARYSPLARIFEPSLFAHRLGELISNTFVKLLVTILPIVALIVFFSFLDLYLSMLAFLPVLFAMVCSLGTLHLLGLPLDLPALVLTIIILGEGLEFSLYIVTAYQRYGRASHPYFALIRSSVLVNSASTMIAFGVLAISRHTVLKSAGITSLVAISFSTAGTLLILPPLLKRLFEERKPAAAQSCDLPSSVLARYRWMKAYARMFARFKLRLDPMFAEMPGMVRFAVLPRTLVDIGTGYGVPACWLSESYPTARVYGIEPAAERVRVASMALGPRGQVVQGRAPDLPPTPECADGAFMLDMIHFLSDAQLTLTLERLHARLAQGAPLTIRAAMFPERRMKGFWWIDNLGNRLKGIETHWRPAERIQSLVTQCGYDVAKMAPSGDRGDLLWVCAVKIDRK
jgi:predicted exporter